MFRIALILALVPLPSLAEEQKAPEITTAQHIAKGPTQTRDSDQARASAPKKEERSDMMSVWEYYPQEWK